jgi:ketosteroid isomerase-like protein
MQYSDQIIHRFYESYSQLDLQTMLDCYSEEVLFSDPVFGLLQGEEVRSMWAMLCKNARNFSLQFEPAQWLDEEYATCKWTASYTFGPSGRKVVNRAKAHMRVQQGKIIEHSDQFKSWDWSSQALGWKGKLLGWTSFMKLRIQRDARNALARYMEENVNAS